MVLAARCCNAAPLAPQGSGAQEWWSGESRTVADSPLQHTLPIEQETAVLWGYGAAGTRHCGWFLAHDSHHPGDTVYNCTRPDSAPRLHQKQSSNDDFYVYSPGTHYLSKFLTEFCPDSHPPQLGNSFAGYAL